MRFSFVLGVLFVVMVTMFFFSTSSAQASEVSAGLVGGVACFTTPAGEADALALAKSPANWTVVVLAPDLAQVESLRRKFKEMNFPIGKLYAERGSPAAMPFVDNFVDLVVTPETEVTPEIMRVLTPVRGRAVAGDKTTYKPALEGGDAWSHYAHSASQNRSSADTALKWPYTLQWAAKPWDDGKYDIAAAAGGRLFRVNVTLTVGGNRHTNGLIARSAYNGQILWKRPVSNNFGTFGSLFVATSDSVYIKDDNGVLVLDPETGREVRRLVGSDDPALECKWIALENGILLVVLGQAPEGKSLRNKPKDLPGLSLEQHGNSPENFTKHQNWFQKYDEGTSLLAFDTSTGKEIWKFEADIVDPAKLAVLGERVFIYADRAYATCLELRTGKPIWKTDAPIVKVPLGAGWSFTFMATERVSAIASPDIYLINSYKDGHCQAFSAIDGKILWTRATGRSNDNPNSKRGIFSYPVIIGKTILDRSGKFFDGITGELTEEKWAMGYEGCGSWCLSTNAVHSMSGSSYDRLTKTHLPTGFMKAACLSGVIVADGILQSGHGNCVNCMEWIGHLAFASQPETSALLLPPSERLEAAPAAPVASGIAALPTDWPTYRANNSRSNSTAAAVPSTAKILWHVLPHGQKGATSSAGSLDEQPSPLLPSAGLYQPPPIAIGDKIYFGETGGNLICLEAATGKEVWGYPTGGRIFSPPSYWNGRIYCGSGDGFVYCIDATTGQLAWRYRIAPLDRRTLVFDHLSSLWPVNANILVQPEQDGKKATVYASAGLIGLIGGVVLCALDANTGQPHWEKNLDKEFPDLTPSATGQLAWNNGKLWLHCGRSGPFIADPATGKMTQPIDFDKFEALGGVIKQNKIRTLTYACAKGQDIGVMPGGWVALGGRQFFFDEKEFHQPRNAVVFLKTTPEGAPNSASGYPDCFTIKGNSTSTMPTWDEDTIFAPIFKDPAFFFPNSALEKTLAQQPFNPKVNDKGFDNRSLRNMLAMPPEVQQNALPEKFQAATIYSPLLSSNAILFITRLSEWCLVAVSREPTPKALWQIPLPSPPATGGFVINSKGHAFLPLLDGSLLCIGE